MKLFFNLFTYNLLKGDYVPIITVYFSLGIIFTLICILWFVYVDFIKRKEKIPYFLIKISRSFQRLTLYWLRKNSKEAINLEDENKKEKFEKDVKTLNHLVFCIVSPSTVIFYLIITLKLILNLTTKHI